MTFKAWLLNRKASQGQPEKIVASLAITASQQIADLGSGGGYFTFLFAKAVGSQGKVFALDTDQGLLESIRLTAQQQGIRHIETVLVSENSFKLPEKMDLIFARNVYHHLEHRTEYFGQLKRLLVPSGRVVIIDYTSRRFGHYTEPEVIVKEMNDAGYKVKQSFDFLKGQSFTVFGIT